MTVKPPETPGRMKTVEPVLLALVNEPKERLGALGAVVSTCTVCAFTASALPTLSVA